VIWYNIKEVKKKKGPSNLKKRRRRIGSLRTKGVQDQKGGRDSLRNAQKPPREGKRQVLSQKGPMTKKYKWQLKREGLSRRMRRGTWEKKETINKKDKKISGFGGKRPCSAKKKKRESTEKGNQLGPKKERQQKKGDRIVPRRRQGKKSVDQKGEKKKNQNQRKVLSNSRNRKTREKKKPDKFVRERKKRGSKILVERTEGDPGKNKKPKENDNKRRENTRH